MLTDEILADMEKDDKDIFPNLREDQENTSQENPQELAPEEKDAAQENSESNSEADGERVYSDFEKEQMAKGWKPDGRKSAEQWAADGDKLEVLSRKLDSQEQLIKQMSEHMKKKEQHGYERALKELQDQRKAAIHLGDVDAVDEYDRQIQQYQQNVQPAAQIKEVADFNERYADILNGSSAKDKAIVAWLQQRDQEIYKEKLAPAEHMSRLEAEMIREWGIAQKEPQVIEEQKATPKVSTQGAVYGQTKKGTITYNDLTAEQRQFCDQYARYGIMTKAEYLADVNKGLV